MSLIPFSYWGDDEVVVNTINQDGLILFQDALDSASYPGSGINWNDTINGVTGQLQNGPVWNSAGHFTFDGVNDQMEYLATNTAPFLFGTGNFTMNCWVYIPDADTVWNLFKVQAPTGFARCNFGFGTTSGGIVAGRRMAFSMLNADAGTGRAAYSTIVTGLNNWKLLTFVRDGGNTFKLYANGVELAQTPTSTYGSANFNFDTTTNWFFSADTGDVNRFNNKVAFTYWYNRALTAAEILANFDVHKSRFGL